MDYYPCIFNNTQYRFSAPIMVGMKLVPEYRTINKYIIEYRIIGWRGYGREYELGNSWFCGLDRTKEGADSSCICIGLIA